MSSDQKSERVVMWLLLGVVVCFGVWIVPSLVEKPQELISFLGFAPNRSGTPLGWLLALLVAGEYLWGAAKIPAVREHLWRVSTLKLLALVAAVMAGVMEEVIFRKWLMDFLERHDVAIVLQVLASGIAFGLAHSVWGLIRRSVDAALHAMLATSILGACLAVVYLLSERSLAPVIVAHFVISALIEPGLLLAAVRGQLGLRIARA
jgi:membrane protease YdiL (CAAX protease family)